MTPLPHEYTGPGLVDLQVNGYAGFDLNGDPAIWTVETLGRINERLVQRGVVAALPTLITDAPEAMCARAKGFARAVGEDRLLHSSFPKLHIEGPFICPNKGPRGAHPQEHCLVPEEASELFDRLWDASSGSIGLLTLAPELPGAVELIEHACARGVVVALGHTQADAREIEAAVAAGATLSTHLGNGSHVMLPRLDNYVQAQLACDDLRASFIADGYHVPPATLKNFMRAKTPQRSILVTDAMAGADAVPGVYKLGRLEVQVDEAEFAHRPGEELLAGSALTLDKAVLNAVRFCDIPFETAWACASVNPASLMGLSIPDVTVNIEEGRFTRRNLPSKV